MKVKRNVFLESSLRFIYFFARHKERQRVEERKQNDRQEVESGAYGKPRSDITPLIPKLVKAYQKLDKAMYCPYTV